MIHYGVAEHAGRGAAHLDLRAHQHHAPLRRGASPRSGPRRPCAATRRCALGANVWHGELVCEGVAESLGLPWKPVEDVIGR